MLKLRLPIFVVMISLVFGLAPRTSLAIDSNEEEINFVFYAPGLKKGTFKYFAKGWGFHSTGAWLQSPPYAWVSHIVSGGGYTWEGHDNVEKFLDWLNGNKKRLVAKNFGPEKFVRNNLGTVEYKTFDGQNTNPTGDQRPLKCIVFSQFYGNMLNRLFGAYCDIKPLSNATITAVLQGLGSKEKGKLPTKPVSHIPELKENQSTKPTVKKRRGKHLRSG